MKKPLTESDLKFALTQGAHVMDGQGDEIVLDNKGAVTYKDPSFKWDSSMLSGYSFLIEGLSPCEWKEAYDESLLLQRALSSSPGSFVIRVDGIVNIEYCIQMLKLMGFAGNPPLDAVMIHVNTTNATFYGYKRTLERVCSPLDLTDNFGDVSRHVLLHDEDQYEKMESLMVG